MIYTPDKDVQVHEEGAIRLICKPFQSHENGLPEWLKNSADAYARENTPYNKRVILVVFDNSHSNNNPSISCIDFVGMTSNNIEQHFRKWADPDAATRGVQSDLIQGGHGNGGKCYMTQMFLEHSYLFTVKGNKGNKYGVVGGSIKFGYVPNRKQGRNFVVNDIKSELNNLLTPLRISIDSLPNPILEALYAANGFSFITGVRPKGYGSRIPVQALVRSIQEHTQMITTLDYCQVYIISNGKVLKQGKPLSLPNIPPIHGYEEPRIITFPPHLKDVDSGEKIKLDLNKENEDGKLILRTSDKSMRYSRRGRHNIIFRTSSGYIGYIPVTELDIQSHYRDRIYGECHLDSLEEFKQNDRGRLGRSPLSKAVEKFISYEIQKFTKEFESLDKRRYDQEAKNEVSKMNEALDQWKNKFLDNYMRGLWGPGSGNPPPTSPPLPTGKPARMDINFTNRLAGIGVSFRPSIRFYDSDGSQIRPAPYRWVSEDTNVAIVDDDLRVINTFACGKTLIYAETLDGKIQSNIVPLEVVNIHEITIEPRDIELPLGSRIKLEAICQLPNEEKSSSVSLVWTESNPKIANVSSSGLVYGFSQGETSVVAGDDHCISDTPANITVTPGIGSGKGDKRGKGLPVILVSGEIDKDPDTKEYVYFSKDDPPIFQRVQDVDRNIWWINSSSPFAQLYLDQSKGYGHTSREWRMYHLERLIEVIIQITITHDKTDAETLSVNEWIMKWGERVSEIQEAAVSDLSAFISEGVLPDNDE
jgi:hypothetical protein